MKKITKLVFALIMAIALPQFAQAQGWTKTFDKQPSNEPAVKMTATANGHVVIGPTTNGYYLLQIDSLGNELWYQTYTTPNSLVLRSLETMSNGDLVMLCIMSSGIQGVPGYAYIAKHEANGTLVWGKQLYQVTTGSNGNSLLVMPGDTLIVGGQVVGQGGTANETEALLYQLGANGDSIRQVVYHDLDTLPAEIHYIANGPNNTIVAVGKGSIESSDITLRSFDSNLNMLWEETTVLGGANVIIIPTDVMATSDGGYLATGYQLNTGGINGIEGYAFFVKMQANGALRWYKQFHFTGDISNGTSIAEPSPGKYALLAMGLLESQPSTYYNGRPYLVFTDSLGNVQSHKVYSGPSYISLIQMRDMNLLQDKGFLLCGGIGQGIIDEDIYFIRTDSLGNVYKSVIAGKLFGDDNENCQFDATEPELKQWIVTAVGVDSFYAVTDAQGNFEISCDTGTYQLSAVLPSNYWVDTLCASSNNVQVLTTSDTINKDLPVGKVLDCPAMKVTVDAVFLRRCLPGPAYTVSYCNNGTASSPNTYVEVSLDSDLVLDSASITYTSLGNNRFRFDVGTVDISECGSFLMHIRVDCSVTVFAQSHCVEADIYPNTVCLPPNPLWDGARLDVTTDCEPDSLSFMIINNGNDMQVPRSFTIIQDDVMYANGTFQLDNLQTFTKKVPSNGSTWTLITEQTPFFPGNANLITSVEGCGNNGSGVFSLGYLVQFPQVGPDPSSAELCLIDRASFDPNDKAVEPKGLGLEGAIDKSQSLNYRIRFQNTGTDTAFLVVILDTLSENLDLLSIRNVRSSHPMQMNVLPGRILEFAYPNILLPDSNVNEPASHGFVSFEIDLVDDLPIGTEITNTAFIYFDQNEAVVTNTTLNTIGELYKTWLSVSDIVNPESRVKFYPNPTQGLLNFTIDNATAVQVDVQVISMQGQQLLVRSFNPSNEQLQLDLEQLPEGVYLLQVRDGADTTMHKVIVAH